MPCGLNVQIGWIPVSRKVDLEDEVKAKDHLEVAIQMLPLLDEKRRDALLREALEKRGWKRGADGTMTKQFGEATATLPPGESKIRLESSAAESIAASASVTRNAPPEDDGKAIEDDARKKASEKLAAERKRAERELTERNVRVILEAEPALRAEVQSVVNEVTRRALELRAAELGRIENVTEDRDENGRYGLTITVRS